ncbi:flagellar motor control protein ZomB [Mycobacterium sp. NPDC003323]
MNRWPAVRYGLSARISLWISVVVAAGLFGWGAWQRRWMADDGLIVLRTVRNLLAGNGPVFNAGERVESNTSTLWTYLITASSWIAGPVRLEYVALALALGLSVAGVVLVMLGTARLYAPTLAGRRALLLPAGVLVYIAVPPARDFATSGLENGLVLAYVGLLWWLLVRWSQARRAAGPVLITGLAFVAGLSVLVRPELALVGGGALVLMVLAAPTWRCRLLIVAVGGALPVAYQIFRMGYYGLLVPQTAIAKDASGAKWSQGLLYLENLDAPYLLWVPMVLLVVLAVVLMRGRSSSAPDNQAEQPAGGRIARLVQNPAAAVVFIVASGLIQAVYWVRQGGDFMHGRVLLTALFLMLAPVAVIPIAVPQRAGMATRTAHLLTGSAALLWVAIAGWALWAANSPGMGADATRVTYSGIVDERRFYAQATGHAHPLTAADYLDYPRMRAMLVALRDHPDGALLLPSGNYDVWDVVPAIPPPPDQPRLPGETGPQTVFFTNMGMSSMNVGLDVRVIDQIGLTNPLAAHTERLEDARIGHDKNLFPDWAVAEGPFLKERPYIPPYLDEDWIAQAEVALTCPETEAMLNAVRAPMGPRRFLSNLVNAMEFGSYRIDRVPLYELRRCGLEIPPPTTPEYTGLPATGP